MKVDIGKNETRIAQPLRLAKLTGDKFTVETIFGKQSIRKLFWFIRNQEIDFRQENAKYRDQMNFDHQKTMSFRREWFCNLWCINAIYISDRKTQEQFYDDKTTG